MAARGSQVMQYVAVEVPTYDSLPSNPAADQIVMYTGVTPYEMLRWTGNGANPAQRRYSANVAGGYARVNDLSDDHTLGVTVRTVAIQAGSGTPSPSNIRAISGKSSIAVRRRGKNLADPTIPGVTTNGVTVSYDPETQCVILNGTCTMNNTNLYFAAPPAQINAAHILSMYYASGSYALSGENSLWMAEASYQNAFGVLAFPDAGRSSSSVVNAARNYVYFALRLDAGSVFTNYTFRLQLEFGSTPSDWEPYAAQAYALIPDAPLYGWGSAQDHVGTDGLAAHYMERVSLTGDEAFDDGSDLGDVVRIGLALSVAGTAGETLAISSHFPQLYSYASNTVHFYVTGSILALFIPKSILSTGNLAGAKAWVKAQATAGTPIQVLYQRANPAYSAVAPVAITGVDGTNTVTSDGASVTVSYTGSGWAAAGAVQRVAVESVSITPEQGLRVDTVLTSADGSQQVPTYFNARGARYGLFRASDGKLINGAKALPSGRAVGVTEALMHPDAPDGTMFLMELRNYLFNLRLGGSSISTNYTVPAFSLSSYLSNAEMGGQFDMSTEPISGLVVKMRTIYSRHFLKLASFTGDSLDMERGGGIILGMLADNTKVAEIVGDYLAPNQDNLTNLGTSSLRWKKVYAASSTISTSDEREKHDITPLDVEMLTRFLMALSPISYRLNAIPEELHYGFTAQAFKTAMDTVGIPADFAGFDGSNPDHLGLCYGELTAIQTAVIQQQQRDMTMLRETADNQAAEIQALKADRDAHKQRLDDLERRLADLEGKTP